MLIAFPDYRSPYCRSQHHSPVVFQPELADRVSSGVSPERSAAGAELLARTEAAIAALSPKLRAAIVLTALQGLSPQEAVESDNRGFDAISRRPHPEDPQTFIDVRFIEVKGRAGVGIVALSENEYRTAERLKSDYWLYAVFNCAGTPELHIIQDPARLAWQPVMAVEHYRLSPEQILREDL